MRFVSLGLFHECMRTLWASQQPFVMLTCATSLLNVNDSVKDVFAGNLHMRLSANQMLTSLLESVAWQCKLAM